MRSSLPTARPPHATKRRAKAKTMGTRRMASREATSVPCRIRLFSRGSWWAACASSCHGSSVAWPIRWVSQYG
jgi:hypothetical protein